MKKSFTILFWTIFVCSCNTFTESSVIDNQDELREIFEIGLNNKIQKFKWGDEDIDGLNWKLQKRQIDCFEIKMTGDKASKSLMELDSIVVFTRKSENMLDEQDNIVYDFAQTPRRLGSYVIESAAYDQKMVADRWYLVKVGFD